MIQTDVADGSSSLRFSCAQSDLLFSYLLFSFRDLTAAKRPETLCFWVARMSHLCDCDISYHCEGVSSDLVQMFTRAQGETEYMVAENKIFFGRYSWRITLTHIYYV